MTIGDRIRRVRLARGLGINELARISGVSNATISELEMGKRDNCWVNVLSQLATALHVPITALLTDAIPIDALAHLSDEDKQFVLNPANSKYIRLARIIKKELED